MKVDYSERAGKSLQNLPPCVRKAVFKQMRFPEQKSQTPVPSRQEIR
jgi:mRNA-degrading endonuclease RelE of RelBE toxin-antitoxin system